MTWKDVRVTAEAGWARFGLVDAGSATQCQTNTNTTNYRLCSDYKRLVKLRERNCRHLVFDSDSSKGLHSEKGFTSPPHPVLGLMLSTLQNFNFFLWKDLSKTCLTRLYQSDMVVLIFSLWISYNIFILLQNTIIVGFRTYQPLDEL